MIGKVGAELDIVKLDELSQVRKLQRLQSIRDDFNSKLDEISGNWIPHSLPVERPYGVERGEGEAYDVWHHILDHVVDSPEIHTLWNVSGMFRDILRRKYIETRLPEVVKLILDKRAKYLIPEEFDGITFLGRRLSIPTWERNKCISAFVNLRMTSKLCKKSVEYICQSGKCHRASLYLDSTGSVRRICDEFEENPSIAASSFPRFKVDVSERYSRDVVRFRQAISDFIQLSGHRISDFTYHPAPAQDTAGVIYNRLRQWLSLMPNIEHLSFELSAYGNIDADAPALEEIQPFPNLPMLRCIQMDGKVCGVRLSPFVQRILETFPGIQELKFDEVDEVREHSRQVLELLSNLSSLQISPHRSLIQHRNLPWKLKKLVLLYDEESDFRQTVPSCLLFTFLKQFEETLEHLELKMVEFFDCCGYLELKNLKTLKMELHASYENLNFLLYVEKLETLEVNIISEYLIVLSQLKRIVSTSFLGRSIWDVFPVLKRFHLRGYDAKIDELRAV